MSETAGVATTSATIAATGKNQLTFAAADAGSLTSVSVTGSGSADLSKVTLTAAKTLTVADGGVSAIINNQTTADVTIVTGAGVDTLSVSGAGLKSATTGAGNDVVTVGNAAQATLVSNITAFTNDAGYDAGIAAATTAAVNAGTITAAQKVTLDGLAGVAGSYTAGITAAQGIADAGGTVSATATINLGAGDDTLTLGAAFATGATIDGGAGKDTIAIKYGDYTTVSSYTSADLAKIKGFETLNITTTALANTNAVDLSKLSGLTSVQILGVVSGSASINNVGANSTVTVKGDMRAGQNNGALTVSLKDASGTNDVVNIVLDQAITQNNDGTVDTFTSAITNLTLTGIETVNVTSTGTLSTAVTTGSATDVAENVLNITNADMKTLTITGDQAATFNTANTHDALTTIDASANTAGVTINAALSDTLGISIKGSATAANNLTGTKFADTIVGGSGNDTIKGGLGGDTLTGNGGNDIFVYGLAAESTIAAGQTDTITDFVANTVGDANTGAVKATATVADRNGDVIDLTFATNTKIKVGVYANASDATTFISTGAAADNTFVYAALDSTNNKLYIDTDANGTADMYINLTGVTTIDAAAFVI